MKKMLAALLAVAVTASMAPIALAHPYEVTEPITIEWWHSQESQYAELIDRVCSDFNASQDKITVKPIYIGNYTTLNEAFVAANAANTGLPAITVANTPYVAEYAANGLTEDLTPYIAATGFDIDDFGAGLITSTSYEGKNVALPFLISTQVIYYNKTMADEKGIVFPETFEGFEEMLEKATVVNPDGSVAVYGTVIPGWDQWYFETLFLNSGVKIITEDNTTDLNSETAKKLVQKFQDWQNTGKAYVAYGANASSNMRQSFFDGKAFSIMHTSSLYNSHVANCDFEVGMAWYPSINGNKNSEVGGCVLLIPAKASQAQKNAGWVFMQYLCSKDINMTWAKETGYMPTRNSVLHTEEGQQFLAEKPAFQCIFDNLDLINPRIQNPAWNQLATIWKNYLTQTVGENMDVNSQMDDMAEEINEVLEDF